MKPNKKARRRALPTALNIIDDTFMSDWTLEKAKKEAKKLLHKAGGNRDWKRAVKWVLRDIETAEAKLFLGCCENDVAKIYDAARHATQHALQAGLKLMAVKSRYEYPTGKGKTEDPAWPFIRRVWKESCKKIGHKEAVRDGVADYRKATGDNREINESSLVSRFKQMIGR